jgi:hypothetical protein
MRTRWSYLVVAGALAWGCSHTRSVESGSAGEEAAGHEKPPQDHVAHHPPPSANPPTDQPAASATGKTEIPIASSPEALLTPGARADIEKKLAHEGLLEGAGDHPGDASDARVREALRKFQRQRNLPATGMPDDATVRALGLNPADVFKHGSTPNK